MSNQFAISILIGNSFPLTLMRRKLVITPEPLAALQKAAAGKRIVSFWGHANTLHTASATAGFDLSPVTDRPALKLSPDAFPILDGEIFCECWVMSPEYRENFRPAVHQEVTFEDIIGWQCLKLNWT